MLQKEQIKVGAMYATVLGYTTKWRVLRKFTNKAGIECITLLHPNNKYYTVHRAEDCTILKG